MTHPSPHTDLLQRWLRGETTRREERELERLAKDDPFLAEALEGYRRHPEGDHEAVLAQLGNHLETRQERSRGIVFYLSRIAAAAALLVVALGGFWWLNQPQAEQVAQDLQAPAVRPGPSTERDDATAEVNEDIPEAEEAQPEPTSPPKPRTPALVRPAEQPVKQSKVQPPPPPPPPGMASEIAQAEEKDILLEEVPTVVPPTSYEGVGMEREESQLAEETAEPMIADDQALAPPQPDEFAARKSDTRREKEPAGPRQLTGRVTDETGAPLIGASVLIVGTNKGGVTDFDGNFRLVLPEGSRQLLVTYTGYTTEEITLSPADTVLDIRLTEPAVTLDEVVVTGLGIKKSQKEMSQASQRTSPRPLGGFDKLETYLQKNLEYPAEALENGIEGAVLLEFTLDKRGRPQNVEVIRSLGYGCDAEAVRLLEEGPRWKDAEPGEKVRYEVGFGKE